MLSVIDRQAAGNQAEADYGVPKGLTIRDEVARYFRIGQALFADFAKAETPSSHATTRFIERLLGQVLGFSDIAHVGSRTEDGRLFAVTLEALSGRVPVVVVPPSDDLDHASESLPTDGRKRSAATAMQDWLNHSDAALWGLASNGEKLRLMRDNQSLTRPTYIEANVRQIFEAEDFASFAALWLLVHASRFGKPPAPATDCSLERWREQGSKQGIAARDRLRDGVEAALVALGTGFLAENPALRERVTSGQLPLTSFFSELLRLVYRLIFLMAAEDRDLLHSPSAPAAARRLYAQGYSLAALRDRSVRRSAWDAHRDRWEGLKITFAALDRGEKLLGLPALGGLFARGEVPDLEHARLSNKALMEAIYRLAWLKDASSLQPVNWRDMETEELGSVYESLLELTPRLVDEGRAMTFAEGAETKGNQRKTTGSYYTPDSLVQALLDSALDPVLDRIEAEADEPSKALERVTVIDPACGSGHFLLAAARRIATRLARLRSGGVASAADYRHALRDVVRNCIHGVDRNPMAVELTKVALWIETVEPGKPLGFLDANIRCGDALLGVFDLDALKEGVPDGAYKPLTGDDKETAKHFAARNKAEKRGQGSLDFASGAGRLPAAPPLGKTAESLRALPEDTVEEVERKKTSWAAAERDPRRWAWRIAADLYVAAFLTPKTGGVPANRVQVAIPTTGQVWQALGGHTVYGPLVGRAQEVAGNARAFHWPLEFPDIMEHGGFDCVLGNPPWERIKLQEEEFFAVRDPEIASAKNAAARKRLIAQLNEINPRLAAEWTDAIRTAECESAFIRLSGRYPLGGVGDINTYAVFADFFRQAISQRGIAGLIVPNGLVTGYSYRDFLRHLLNTKTLASFFGFENEDKIFPSVHNETKFGLLTIHGSKGAVEKPWFTAHLRHPDGIKRPERRYQLTIDEIEAINPNTLNLPAFRQAKDAEVTAAIHKNAPVLIHRRADGQVDNPWYVNMRTLFHMAGASGDFQDDQDIAPLIVERREALAILRDGRTVYPLYEGKMFWHFDHRYGTYAGQTEKQANKGVLPHVSDAQHDNPTHRSVPRYWVDAGATDQILGEELGAKWFFAWRDVGPSERTFIGTVVPRTAIGHTAPILISRAPMRKRAALCGILSSLVVDYAARQKTNRMTFFVVEQLPILSVTILESNQPWIGSSPIDWLADRVLELCYTNEELSSFGEDLGRTHPPFRWDPHRRVILQAEIDAAVLHLYGMSHSQAEWLIESFTVLRKYEEKEYGEFRTKRIVLDIYGEMEAAKQANGSYRSRLDPAAADLSCCHEIGPTRQV
ncbi:hypothetical protein AU467_25350 [Mesorhizobium loti]|uniref:site-specific DNA-methyltransferase (adenine-specific) n=1 Tax=Rhizobium loti TaxID=381 RepID=A0A101KRG5_RHILI|nr:hypothetical protein AU467_25350 [Mesorhizobium loti]